jgi:hypothetical protein
VLPMLPPGHHVTCGIRKQGDVKYDLQRLIRILGTVSTKIITEITYGLHFGCSLYGWKDKRITFRMDLVSRPNTILFHGKHRNNEAYRIYQGVALPYFGMMGMYRVEPNRGMS